MLFEKKVTLSSHKSKVHREKDPEKKFKCPICESSTFNKKSGLQEHIKSVHDGKAFRCEVCDIMFDKKVTLSFHKSRGHDENPVEYVLGI